MSLNSMYFYLASAMILASGASLLSARFVESNPSAASALELTKYLLPGGFLVLGMQRLAVSDLIGATLFVVCAFGIALAQYHWKRRTKSRSSST